MKDKLNILLGAEANLKFLETRYSDALNGLGSITCISGETGYGKSELLWHFFELIKDRKEPLGAFVENAPPMSNANLVNIQPLQTFRRILEELENPAKGNPKRRFLRNAAMTILSMTPIAGDVFYGIKHLAIDYEKYKKERKAGERWRQVSEDVVKNLKAKSENDPLVIIVDDMHWADAHSVEALNLLAESIVDMHIMFVFTYRKSLAVGQKLPITGFLSENESHLNKYFLELKEFDKATIEEAVKTFIPNYKKNDNFIDWLQKKTFGAPSLVIEYAKYFADNPPFDRAGNLTVDLDTGNFRHYTIQTILNQVVEQLTEEEKNILSICAIEGKEFTVSIAAELLNMDILTVIRKLKALQNKLGIIRSIGAIEKYGAKTTVYQFTQALYHDHFLASLEMEEKLALHREIVKSLKERLAVIEDEEARQELTANLAAHSIESGDDETAKMMLLDLAETARKIGSEDSLRTITESYNQIAAHEGLSGPEPGTLRLQQLWEEIHGKKPETSSLTASETGAGGFGGSDTVSYASMRNHVVELYHAGKLPEAVTYVDKYIENYKFLDDSQKAQLYVVASKALLDLEKFEDAELRLKDAEILIENKLDSVTQCLILNMRSIMAMNRHQVSDAFKYLSKAAEKAVSSTLELKLLTLTNIAFYYKERDPRLHQTYLDNVRKYAKALKYEDYGADIFGAS